MQNSDHRAEPKEYVKMLHCAEQHATKLFGNKDNTLFVFITDNKDVKKLVAADAHYKSKVYMTNIETARVTENDGYNSLIEMLLLASSDGIVVNKTKKMYMGTALNVSLFAQLAKRISLKTDEEIFACDLDSDSGATKITILVVVWVCFAFF